MKGNWKDYIKFNWLDGQGYLTEDAKEFMREHKLKSLEEALNFVETKGDGYWYTNDLDRPDVHYSGHIAFAIQNMNES